MSDHTEFGGPMIPPDSARAAEPEILSASKVGDYADMVRYDGDGRSRIIAELCDSHERLRAEVAAARERDSDESAWVIVCGWPDERDDAVGALKYYTADNRHWSRDHADAIRLSRKQDAQRLRAKVAAHDNALGISIEEHIWTDAARSPSAPDTR